MQRCIIRDNAIAGACSLALECRIMKELLAAKADVDRQITTICYLLVASLHVCAIQP